MSKKLYSNLVFSEMGLFEIIDVWPSIADNDVKAILNTVLADCPTSGTSTTDSEILFKNLDANLKHRLPVDNIAGSAPTNNTLPQNKIQYKWLQDPRF